MNKLSVRARSVSSLPALCALALASVTASATARAQDAGVSATAAPTIAAVDPAELEAIRPLLARGPVIVPRAVDQHSASRPTIYVRVQAPMAVAHRVVRSPDEYRQFVPALGSVELQGRTGRRTAFRFRATAAIFDVTADVRVNVVNDRRVDVDITRSDFGPAGSRWEFFAESPTTTVVALTVWCDPAQATWAIRQFANSSAYSASSANITASANPNNRLKAISVVESRCSSLNVARRGSSLGMRSMPPGMSARSLSSLREMTRPEYSDNPSINTAMT